MVLVGFVVNKDAVAITNTYCQLDLSPREVIIRVASQNKFKQVNFLLDLAKIESGYNSEVTVLDTNDRYSIGLFQMQQAFWADNCIPLFQEEEDIYNPEQQTLCVIHVVQTKGIDFVESTGG